MGNNSSTDIAVFTFARGSQLQTEIYNGENYQFVGRIIDTMMSRHGVDTPKIGIGGTKEDVICFIAGLIDYQLMYHDLNIQYTECDTTEFDPDVNPDVYDDAMG